MKMLRMTEAQLAAREKKLQLKKWNDKLAEIDRRQVTVAAVVPSPKPSKYRNVREGNYASRKEAARAAELKLMEKARKIRNLREQVRYELIPTQRSVTKQVIERPCAYVADFVYEEPSYVDDDVWLSVCEECKGMRTPDYVIKRKLMLHVHGIRIRET